MKLSAGLSPNGEYKSTLYRAKGKRYFVVIERVDGKTERTDLGNGLIVPTPRTEHLNDDEWLQWHRSHEAKPTW